MASDAAKSFPPVDPVRTNTDIAALSAGVVAVMVALFVTPGDFSVINLPVSLALTSLIYAYVWPHQRLWPQSVAVAAVAGLALLPAVGFIDETLRSREPGSYMIGYFKWKCGEDLDPCIGDGQHESRVWNGDLAIAWLVCFVGALAADCYRQRPGFRAKLSGAWSKLTNPRK
jgi:hypothetical protein